MKGKKKNITVRSLWIIDGQTGIKAKIVYGISVAELGLGVPGRSEAQGIYHKETRGKLTFT